MREYVRMTGAGGAFGWAIRSGDGYAAALGGLSPRMEYTLWLQDGKMDVRMDAQGTWRGMSLHSAPLAVSRAERLVMHDAQAISPVDAALLIAPKKEKAAKVMETQKIRQEEKTESVAYRAISTQPGVDALPEILWRGEAKKLQPYFQQKHPVHLFDAPGWKYVQVSDTPGTEAYVGVHVQGDCTDAVLYAVRARGGMAPPKALRGYRYRQGYWVLERPVQP